MIVVALLLLCSSFFHIRRCVDLRSQAEHHVAHARKLEDEERSVRERQERERDALKMKQIEEEVQTRSPILPN